MNPHAFQSNASSIRQPGTGDWFVKKVFPAWLESEIPTSSILWLKGKCKSSNEKEIMQCSFADLLYENLSWLGKNNLIVSKITFSVLHF